MERISVDHEHVVGADYSGLSLVKFSAQGSTFEKCTFDRIKVGDASFGAGTEQSVYAGCSFDRAALTFLGNFVRFTGCTFHNARFVRPSADYLEFVDCTFTGRITGLTLNGAPPDGQSWYEGSLRSFARQGRPEPAGYRELVLRERNQIRGNDFTGAELVKVSFRFGVDLSAQKLPAGDDYVYVPDAEAAVERALAALADDASEVATKARRFLERALRPEIGYGQRQLLLRPKDFESRKAVPADVLLAADLLRSA
ncbi:hypothetical protein GCM10010112_13870 [Actinoplanes lobatus]|uniref:Uncharacterized protein YjbI with pentapeptide repeats n=1 Tax=Actinoplanes lobatus TaxID=113568 RepID=A0A7W7HMG1_9ACTN|nr:hypothetical protein [Actinoplanes lobatus]MBB4753223.1 uncharacterized protein YjbI with pentapeptide repeats [Actinoplanes lobatus]GGN59192.1 hypothetical protein GCM10010112_13870 [Actinoplanes lobatus]GIE42916.1 hypothetical protein Alo02nite_58140 [Actinoplanes lobatus]